MSKRNLPFLLGGQFNYSQRGPNAEVWLSQHAFQPDRYAKELKAFYHSNGIRFPDATTNWTRNPFLVRIEPRDGIVPDAMSPGETVLFGLSL